MILLIDNYDSFSYNLYQLVGSINPDIKVIRNDEMTLEEIEALHPEKIILSPGPGKPSDAGVCVEAARYFAGKVPILGVCLGHQSICEAYGATVSYAKTLMHGKQSDIEIDTDCPLFKGLPEVIKGARYHSLAAVESTIPDTLRVIARTDDGEIMAVRHAKYQIYGVQFHPESILTPQGSVIIRNFLEEIKETAEKTEGNCMIKDAIIKVSNREDLSYEMAEQVMDEIMNGEATNVQIASLLSGLTVKGETIEEISAAASSMRNHAVKIHPDKEVLEIVGTGGDKSNSFNISTTAAMVIAAAGVPVAKHGNRAASSKSGAADVLEALGVNITAEPAKMEEVLNKENICFLFAQKYHSAMKYVAPVRKELGIRTLFNVLGPIANPASPSMQVLGVYSKDLVDPMAHVLQKIGVKNALVVFGEDVIDEITTSAPTYVCEVRENNFKTYEIKPEDFGFKRCSKDDLQGGTPQENAAITRAILSGEEKGAKRDTVLMNAGAGIYVARPELGLDGAIKLAAELIDSGKALEKLNSFVAMTNE